MTDFEKQFIENVGAYYKEDQPPTKARSLSTLLKSARIPKYKIAWVGSKKKKLPQQILSVYFGVPGAGKTTFAAYLTKHDLKRGIPVWSNVPITGAYKLEPKDDIGKYMIAGGRVIIDEAGLEYNNRDFKAFSKDSLYFYKYHRHYQLAVDVFSQGYDDMDKKIRTLAQKLYVVKKSLLG